MSSDTFVPSASKLDQTIKPEESISISQVCGLCCRYIKSAVEIADSRARVKRLSDISKELTTARKFKALQDSSCPAIWVCLKNVTDVLAASEEGDDIILTTTKEDAYALAMETSTNLSSTVQSLERDYFFESMILDINTLHSTLNTVRSRYMQIRQKNELLKAMSKAKSAADIEPRIRDASNSSSSLEVDAAKNFIVLFGRIEEARRQKSLAEDKLREMALLVENQQASIR